MKTINKISLAAVGVVGLAVPITFAARQEPVIQAGVSVQGVKLGGLSPEEAQRKLRIWWEQHRMDKVQLTSKAIPNLPAMTPGQLGVGLDDVASVKELPMAAIIDQAIQATGQTPAEQDFPAKFKVLDAPQPTLKAAIEKATPDPKPARVRFSKGQILLSRETSVFDVDISKVGETLVQMLPQSVKQGKPLVLELPSREKPKHVPDDALLQIRDVVSSYTTSFPASNRPRTANLKLASDCFPGIILMPGDVLSYNDTVGERSIKRGFKEAGIFVNGRLDSGVGGGICQVSSTLYNAALLANLKITERQNHSVPVVYVPLGRDSTVYFGSIDLKIKNDGTTPVAITSELQGSRLTFRVLGKKTEGLAVRIESGGESRKPITVRTKVDGSIPPGTRRVVEKGSPRRTIATYRVVMQDGKVLRRESLGTSVYGGLPTIVAVGASASTSASNETTASRG